MVCDENEHSDDADVKDRPRKIAHVNLNAAQLEKSNAFLVDVLGFRKVDHSGPLHFFHCDSTDHSSMVMGAAATPTLNHVSFELSDLEVVHARRRTDARRRLSDRMGRRAATAPATTCSAISRGRRSFRSSTPPR